MFFAVGVIWGIPYFLIRIAVRDLSPAFLVFSRTLPATLLLLPIALRRGGWRALAPRWKALVLYTFAEVCLPWLMLFRAEQRLPSSLSGLLIATVPLIALVFAKLSGSTEFFSPARLVGLGTGLVGVAAVVGIDVHGGDIVSVGELGLTACGYALGPTIVSRRLAHIPSLLVVTSSLALASAIYAPIALTHLPHRVTNETVASVVTLVVVCTAAGFLAFFALIAEVGPARATVVTYINPAVAVVLGVVGLHEAFGVGTAIGFPLVILGSYLATRSSPRPTSQAGSTDAAVSS